MISNCYESELGRFVMHSVVLTFTETEDQGSVGSLVDAAVKDDDIMDVAYFNAAFLDVTVKARWWVVEAVDKKRARLNCIQHLLGTTPMVRCAARGRETTRSGSQSRLFAPTRSPGRSTSRPSIY